ncbi:diaminobutyrate--2-oxoglutarate transaminase [Paenibacillus xylanexedens]|uniref:diaminobutyrate--2-oxoglutarate transaminase n=1 Tax=Paenibacillus xylanexedens TaxID=528191 RepID=UPI0021B430A2|nr:diaminobutyrate--2-oxoglutarate transaminase [Paenibacillus xylanexedens]
MESNVRSYCRHFPDVFDKAKDDQLFTVDGYPYIDFFAGAGALNYGHNNEYIKNEILAYIESDRIMHGLDMYTQAKQDFIEYFSESVLKKKGLEYKFQFCGPTGTNAVEAALKLARKYTGRTGVFSFMGGYHGMSLGSLAVTSNRDSRQGAGRALDGVTFIPYPNEHNNHFDSAAYIEYILQDTHSGIEKPAAIIMETVQAEGGVYVAETSWLKKIREICDQYDILLICDDVQVGCGRTGPFFSFERAEIVPDLVVLSKSISGYGLPMSLLLMKPHLDIWNPGEHNGTFRGNQLAFIAAKAALEYREQVSLEEQVYAKETMLKQVWNDVILKQHPDIDIRGTGLIWGLDFSKFDTNIAAEVQKACYERGLIVERVGRHDSVVKVMPPLNISNHNLRKGCDILRDSIASVLISQEERVVQKI